MVAKVPGIRRSIVHEHTGILQSDDKLRHHNKNSCIPKN